MILHSHEIFKVKCLFKKQSTMPKHFRVDNFCLNFSILCSLLKLVIFSGSENNDSGGYRPLNIILFVSFHHNIFDYANYLGIFKKFTVRMRPGSSSGNFRTPRRWNYVCGGKIFFCRCGAFNEVVFSRLVKRRL